MKYNDLGIFMARYPLAYKSKIVNNKRRNTNDKLYIRDSQLN